MPNLTAAQYDHYKSEFANRGFTINESAPYGSTICKIEFVSTDSDFIEELFSNYYEEEDIDYEYDPDTNIYSYEFAEGWWCVIELEHIIDTLDDYPNAWSAK